MRIFSRTTKVLGVTEDELGLLERLIAQARKEKRAEASISSSESLAIEVDNELYGRHTRS